MRIKVFLVPKAYFLGAENGKNGAISHNTIHLFCNSGIGVRDTSQPLPDRIDLTVLDCNDRPQIANELLAALAVMFSPLAEDGVCALGESVQVVIKDFGAVNFVELGKAALELLEPLINGNGKLSETASNGHGGNRRCGAVNRNCHL